jgi:hypothetical protein
VILELRNLEAEGLRARASLGYTARPHLKNPLPTNKKKKSLCMEMLRKYSGTKGLGLIPLFYPCVTTVSSLESFFSWGRGDRLNTKRLEEY